MHCAASHNLTLTWIVVCLDFYADSFDFRHVVVAGLAAWSTHNFGDLQLDIVVVLSQDLLNCPDIFTKLIHFSIYGLNIILAIYKHVVGTSAQNLRLTEIKSMLVMKWFFRVACCWAQKKNLKHCCFSVFFFMNSTNSERHTILCKSTDVYLFFSPLRTRNFVFMESNLNARARSNTINSDEATRNPEHSRFSLFVYVVADHCRCVI